MSKLMSIAVVAFLGLGVSAAAAGSPQATNQGKNENAAASSQVPARLVGTWKAPTEQLPVVTGVGTEVYGPDAMSVRDIELRITAAGDGRLTISRKVLDAKGKTVAGSPSVEEATFKVGGAHPAMAGRLVHDVTAVKGERRYLDDAASVWPLEGLRVSVVAFENEPRELEVRFDPLDGRGSVVEILRR